MTDDAKTRDTDRYTPHAVTAAREIGEPDQLKPHREAAEARQESLVDEGVEETLPESGPVSAKSIT